MPLSEEQAALVEATIRESLRDKFQNYEPESKNMPFHYRLLGQDRMALLFIYSIVEYNIWNIYLRTSCRDVSQNPFLEEFNHNMWLATKLVKMPGVKSNPLSMN